MILKMFGIYDSKVSAFESPFFVDATGRAVRFWESLVNDPKTDYNKFPSDFILYELGTFDNSTGVIEMLPTKIHLGVGKDFLGRISPERLASV